jgi:hypothetical protein
MAGLHSRRQGIPESRDLTAGTCSQLKGNFAAQFDLGSDISALYGNGVKNYYPSRAALLNNSDTVN